MTTPPRPPAFRPAPLDRAQADRIAALDWTFVLAEIGLADLSGICCAPRPWPLDPPLYPMAYETISSLPRLCNFGLALLRPGENAAPHLPRHLIPPKGWHVAGISAARRAQAGPHPFPEYVTPDARDARAAIEAAVLANAPLPDAPRMLLRAKLRQMAETLPERIRPYAEIHDRPLFLSL